MAQATTTAPKPLSGNDVSILFPAPKNQSDLANLIALSDLSGPSGAPTKSRSGRTEISIASGDRGGPRRHRPRCFVPDPIADDVKRIEAWFVAGIRIDPGAPGLSPAIIAQFGQLPQIRFIVQPVIPAEANGSIKIHDIAAHLIFSFSVLPPKPPETRCLPRSIPDDTAFKAVVSDLLHYAINWRPAHSIQPKWKPRGRSTFIRVFKGATAQPFRNALKAMLEKHLAPPRLTAMAIMGLDEPEPWIFLAMQKYR